MAIWIGEILLSLVMIVFASAFIFMSSNFPVNVNPVDVGAAAFPKLMALMSIVLAMAIIARSYIKRNENNEAIVIEDVYRLVIGIFSLAVYLYIMPIIGYFITTPIYLIFLMALQGNRKIIQMLSVSIGFTLFAYIIFFKILKVFLP